jgi:hypothetical protein
MSCHILQFQDIECTRGPNGAPMRLEVNPDPIPWDSNVNPPKSGTRIVL